ncbi:MAG: acyl carrier protein [Stomatobaculum sp.]
MTRDEVIEKVIEIVKDVVDIDDELTAESDMQEDVGIDSLDFYNLLGRLESDFKIRMPERVLAKTQTIEDIAAAVMNILEK